MKLCTYLFELKQEVITMILKCNLPRETTSISCSITVNDIYLKNIEYLEVGAGRVATYVIIHIMFVTLAVYTSFQNPHT